jgi:hypothetical protein
MREPTTPTARGRIWRYPRADEPYPWCYTVNLADGEQYENWAAQTHAEAVDAVCGILRSLADTR